ncbi:uncharacterized protein LOC117122063 [Anneissia japonica]|uniref:uncharacterized protein LOC117122063 n=1 Tax=Anneissia japonica TaxID=1529436 RepID=UPI001425B3C7|nr:uncharacterized protein LOC117122063 [Anneissia japonica]
MFLVTRSQLVITSDQVAKEGDAEVAIACDYSQVTNTPRVNIRWYEVNEARLFISEIVNHVKTVNGRYSLGITPGNAELIIAKPVRNDTNKRFLYLDQPVLTASKSRVYEGESAILTCTKRDGDPVPSITWYKDGQALSCTTDTSRCTTSEDALKIYIEAATDGGRYICKAESDQYRGEDGKTSNQFDLKVIHLTITFESEAATATCIAKGHPKPSSVMIYNDGKMIDKEELIASVKINEELCKTNISCYAENGEVNATEPLKTCNTENGEVNAIEPLKTCNTVPSSSITLTIGMFFVGVFVGCFGLVAGLIGYNKIKQKKFEAMRSTDTGKQNTYTPYIADTGDESHTYQDLQLDANTKTDYVNAKVVGMFKK